jgi:hypothetical protein
MASKSCRLNGTEGQRHYRHTWRPNWGAIMAKHVNQMAGVVVSAAALAAVAAATVSAAPPTRPASSAGTVTGRLLIEGGPINPRTGRQPGKRPIPGTIRFISTRRGTVTTRAGRCGTFTARLPAGTYRVSFRTPRILEESSNGTSHQTWSSPSTVTITPRHTTRIMLVSIVP